MLGFGRLAGLQAEFRAALPAEGVNVPNASIDKEVPVATRDGIELRHSQRSSKLRNNSQISPRP